MPYRYDDQNIFAKILRGEIPNRTVLETEHSLAFEDIAHGAQVRIGVLTGSIVAAAIGALVLKAASGENNRGDLGSAG